MCRTVHAVLSTAICGVQMLVRVFMTIILMLENLIRMILQTLYNFISFMLQMISLIPICVVFLVTARLKCFMCGGGGPCPVNRGGACDCLMSAAALIILFFIFRATGVLDKIFYKLGYVPPPNLAVVRFVPTPGDVTECSRNDSNKNPTQSTTIMTTTPANLLRYLDYISETETETEEIEMTKLTTVLKTNAKIDAISPVTKQMKVKASKKIIRLGQKDHLKTVDSTTTNPMAPIANYPNQVTLTRKMNLTLPPMDFSEINSVLNSYSVPYNMTTVLYYLV